MQAGMQAACVHDGSSCKRLYNLLCPDVWSNVAILTQAWQVVPVENCSKARPWQCSFANQADRAIHQQYVWIDSA